MINIVEESHKILMEFNNPKIAVDMTAGNGYDTLFLSRIALKTYAFDIQELAIRNSKKLLNDNNVSNVELIHDNHNTFDTYVKTNVDIAIYNLGYLPNGDKSIKTNPRDVIISLEKLVHKLNHNGIIVIVLYHHDENEINEITEYASNLSNEFDVTNISILNKIDCPSIIKIRRT